MTYAVARLSGEPLEYVGDDFDPYGPRRRLNCPAPGRPPGIRDLAAAGLHHAG
jgi:hypothetical protein